VRLVLKDIGRLVTLAEFGEGPARGPLAELAAVDHAFLIAEDGRVAFAGPMSRYRREWERGAATVLSLGDMLVTPGLVDAHTHLVFAGWRADEFALRLRGVGYRQILAAGGGIHRTVAATRAAGEEELFTLGLARLDQMLRRGVTTVESKSGYGLDLETELKQLRVNRRLDREHPVDVVSTYLGAHVVPAEHREDPEAYVRFMLDTVQPAVRREGLAEFCDVFCEEGAFDREQTRRLLRKAAALGFGLKLHADELHAGRGAELAVELGATSADHLLCVSETGMKVLAASSTVAVLLPGTAFFLGADSAPGRRLIDEGAAVALATDFNPGSCPLLDLRMTMTMACLKMRLTPAEALVACTLNAAHAVGRADRAGSLREGKPADLVVWDCPDWTHLPYRMGEDLVHAVFKAGRMVYRSDRVGPQSCASGRT